MVPAWPTSQKGAVSFAFDGGWEEHVQVMLKLSESGVPATAYLEATRALEFAPAWRRLAQGGSELGNHALYDLIDESGLIAAIPEAQIDRELDGVAELLANLGSPNHTAALPLARFEDDEGSPVLSAVVQKTVVRVNQALLGPALAERYEFVRGSHPGMNRLHMDALDAPEEVRLHSDPRDLLTMPGEVLSMGEFCRLLEQAQDEAGWLIVSYGVDRNQWFSAPQALEQAKAAAERGLLAAPVRELGEKTKKDAASGLRRNP